MTTEQSRTAAATAASSAAARKRRIAKLVAALEREGFHVELTPVDGQ